MAWKSSNEEKSPKRRKVQAKAMELVEELAEIQGAMISSLLSVVSWIVFLGTIEKVTGHAMQLLYSRGLAIHRVFCDCAGAHENQIVDELRIRMELIKIFFDTDKPESLNSEQRLIIAKNMIVDLRELATAFIAYIDALDRLETYTAKHSLKIGIRDQRSNSVILTEDTLHEFSDLFQTSENLLYRDVWTTALTMQGYEPEFAEHIAGVIEFMLDHTDSDAMVAHVVQMGEMLASDVSAPEILDYINSNRLSREHLN